ncbi:chorismate-binding protein [Texcoconibacillus texcoconensis]|uniref:Para-aminobenzoate synthetase component 1 n=1 Tax=Texcoconibacillus texcoconensis TaxID=1095777 RepID=A0A840QU34_9BACI|nr:para-aminobenzoate synthetase component 1 [Texcoconibacillus texcoconensis]
MAEGQDRQRRPWARTRKLTDSQCETFKVYQALTENQTHHVLLESGRAGRYSIMGVDPWAELRGKNNELTVTMNGEEIRFEGPLLSSLKTWFAKYETVLDPSMPDFQGGAIGWISYDMVREFENIPPSSSDDLNTDDVHLFVFDDVYVVDHKENCVWMITNVYDGEEVEGRLSYLDCMWEQALRENVHDPWYKRRVPQEHSKNAKPSVQRTFSEEGFHDAVRKVQEYISAGDVFQVNLSVRESRPLNVHSLHIYDTLRTLNPSPYMGYFHAPNKQLVSGSPELLVKKDGNNLSTRPIAGTRSRGKDRQEDEHLANTLINNDKERAEHVMLVDLERNDLGRVCRFGSVMVDELMVIERYSHVMHIVSNVCGEIAENKDAFDAIAATFPGGTITGAPKVRTMEIIEELEPVRRGVYTGSLGWIGFNGDMELNISIRTMVVEDGVGHVQAGAGIVIDSEPEAEYKESLKKAKALWKATELSEEEMRASALK